MQAYSDPQRENDPHALPDVEVFWHDGDDSMTDDSGDALPEGFYYWYCFPGCLPDSDPIGPFTTEAEALEEAQANND